MSLLIYFLVNDQIYITQLMHSFEVNINWKRMHRLLRYMTFRLFFFFKAKISCGQVDMTFVKASLQLK